MTFESLRMRIKIKKSMSIGGLFEDSFSLFQGVWLQGLLLQVLTILVLYGLGVLAYIPIMGTAFVTDEITTYATTELSVLEYILLGLYLLIYVIVAIFQVGLTAAFYRIMRVKDLKLGPEKGVNYGMFFKKAYLTKLIGIGVFNLIMITIASILFVIPLFYLIIPIQAVILFFAFHPHLSLKQLYHLAFSFGTRHWGICFIVFAGMFVFGMLGVLVCFFGVLATISACLIPIYQVYKQVIGFTEVEDAIASIGQ